MNNNTARLQREKEFHDRRFGGDDSQRACVAKYYSVVSLAQDDYRTRAMRKGLNGSLLECGCATGVESFEWLNAGASVTGIDISGKAIEKASQQLKGSEFENKAKFLEMNAEDMEFDASTFDVIVGNGIIHHLNLPSVYGELARVLNKEGSAVFIEPTGHNPIINIFRYFTPTIRTRDEHPIRMADIELAKKYFGKVETNHYNLFTLLAVPLRKTSAFKPVLNFLHKVDTAVFKLPGFKRLGWTVVIELSEPFKPELKG